MSEQINCVRIWSIILRKKKLLKSHYEIRLFKAMFLQIKNIIQSSLRPAIQTISTRYNLSERQLMKIECF